MPVMTGCVYNPTSSNVDRQAVETSEYPEASELTSPVYIAVNSKRESLAQTKCKARTDTGGCFLTSV